MCVDSGLLPTQAVMCEQAQAHAANAEERLVEARSMQASAEGQAEQALACLQSLAAGSREDSSAMDLLRVCKSSPSVK